MASIIHARDEHGNFTGDPPQAPKHGDLMVWHIPNIPGDAIRFPVASLREAKVIIDVLAEYDQDLFNMQIRYDYSNASGLVVYDANCELEEGKIGDWVEWMSQDGDCIDDVDFAKIDTVKWELADVPVESRTA